MIVRMNPAQASVMVRMILYERQIERRLQRTKPTKKQVVKNGQRYEVTTYRK